MNEENDIASTTGYKNGKFTAIWLRATLLTLYWNIIQEWKKYSNEHCNIRDRWRGNKIFDCDEYAVRYSGTKKQNVFGTGFLVHTKLKNNILNFQPVEEWVCYLWRKGYFLILCLSVRVHQPNRKVKPLGLYYMIDWIGLNMRCQHYIKIITGYMNDKNEQRFNDRQCWKF